VGAESGLRRTGGVAYMYVDESQVYKEEVKKPH
jgi:hypothetical protein